MGNIYWIKERKKLAVNELLNREEEQKNIGTSMVGKNTDTKLRETSQNWADVLTN